MEDSIKLKQYDEVLNCQLGYWPMKYLGVPIIGPRIRIRDLNFIE
jgi:hypothetical protein